MPLPGGRSIGCAAIAVALAMVVATQPARAADPPTPWDGSKPFQCEVQDAGFEAEGPHPELDPYCVHFDKTRQNLTELGVVDFFLLEPARVAAAVDKCFYFQTDHWRGSVVQDNEATKTYEWIGHYYFDKAKGEGGVWVTDFNVNGHTGDPRDLPGFPEEYKPFFGPGEGGVTTHDDVEADPRCAARAAEEGDQIYRRDKRRNKRDQPKREKKKQGQANQGSGSQSRTGDGPLDGLAGTLHLG